MRALVLLLGLLLALVGLSHQQYFSPEEIEALEATRLKKGRPHGPLRFGKRRGPGGPLRFGKRSGPSSFDSAYDEDVQPLILF